ncbi:MAG: aminopeptidase P family protein [Candidatus Omnitrophica bacterium]|nr:aminopeptidase P family protein [Candidatus Omnitrophota bacterium]
MNPSAKKLRIKLKAEKIDALFVSYAPNVSYISGFEGKDSCLIIGRDGTDLFITDFRYYEQAKKEVKGYEVICLNAPIAAAIKGIIKKYKFKKLGFESGRISFDRYKSFRLGLNCALKPVSGLIEQMRLIKSGEEIEKIRKSVKAAKSALNETVKYIKPGMSELEVAGFLEWKLRSAGAQEMSFNTIVASGTNSSMPHAIPTAKKIKKREPIIMDCGCLINGYNSDLTRTILLGRIDAQFKYIYNTIIEAQNRAISSVRPGKTASSIDNAARRYIKQIGFGRYFGHSTGHGVGCEIHEAPSISAKNKHLLKPGMVFTIEPGIYIPGWGGVRMEDIVVVTKKSHEVLTR